MVYCTKREWEEERIEIGRKWKRGERVMAGKEEGRKRGQLERWRGGGGGEEGGRLERRRGEREHGWKEGGEEGRTTVNSVQYCTVQ